ncbi:capsular biosynthesis protein [Pseudarthrobacter sp. Y6]|uniref:polysaccharide biosynthesis C-terminal domain-containing protein n=1 Tax=Pseudarthrobacter sp. Y6 TaxID=3418422 RepID=UPI003CEE03A0
MSLLEGTERLVHLAGVNRGTDEEVRSGNVEFAQQLAESLLKAGNPPQEVVFANSVQTGNGSVYGEAKAEASAILKSAAEIVGANYTDVELPNLFGEHGKPFYNSVVATFCHLLEKEQTPEVKDDKELVLVHAQNAAEVLVGAASPESLSALSSRQTVSGLLVQLKSIAETYRSGDIPDVCSSFDLDLFNTYRSFRVGSDLPFKLERRADARGSFFEVCRSHGGQGQTSFSTTAPGITRGQHFHRRKVERFVVLSGEALISMRQLFTGEVLRFRVTGDSPVAIDMPTLWTHDMTNVGDSELYTMFWTNDIFDPSNPDTIAEEV